MDLVDRFIEDGFVRLEGAFSDDLAAQCREILWKDTGCDPDDPATWTRPVVRLGEYSQEPFRLAANTPALHESFDLLVGDGGWVPRGSLGTFPIRFPHPDDPGDAGWHVEGSICRPDGKYGINLWSSGRALLMLFLFSDVGPDDAPTKIRIGSHLDVPSLLEPAGKEGVEFFAFAPRAIEATDDRTVTFATGNAGDVYLCHPFVVHSAQPHHGSVPRFMAQPPLLPARPYGPEGNSPVEIAIRRGLS